MGSAAQFRTRIARGVAAEISRAQLLTTHGTKCASLDLFFQRWQIPLSEKRSRKLGNLTIGPVRSVGDQIGGLTFSAIGRC
jgi:hypothetical protein